MIIKKIITESILKIKYRFISENFIQLSKYIKYKRLSKLMT